MAKEPRTAYIALGSNLPWQGLPPRRVMMSALQEIERSVGVVSGRSSLYETEPVGVAGQSRYLNAVVRVEAESEAEHLMDKLLQVEARFGRTREGKNNARTLDLDLLLLGAQVLKNVRVELPHPRMAERRFVLQPLAELAPGLMHPALGRSMQELLDALPRVGVHGPDSVLRVGPLA